jgi:uncharacterized protein
MRSMKLATMLMLGLMTGAGAMVRAQESAQTPAATALPEDQQATKEQVTKLFEVMRLRQQMDSMMKMIPAMAQQTAQQQQKAMLDQLGGSSKLTPEQQAKVNEMTTRILDKAIASYPTDGILADATAVYQRHISREDADAMIAFYSSPAGQHLLDAQPVIMHEYMPMVMERMKGMNKVLADDVAKELKDYFATLPATDKK